MFYLIKVILEMGRNSNNMHMHIYNISIIYKHTYVFLKIFKIYF